MGDSTAVELSPTLVQLQAQWLALSSELNGRSLQDDLYAREFGPLFAPHFASLPLSGAPASMPRPKAMVSVLGLSWQPVALMAAWCKPERMLVLGTEDSFKQPAIEGEGVLSLIARVAGISREVIEPVTVGDQGEADIYRAVRDFVRRSGVPAREIFVDPTGGKKSMSASAALAGFLEGSPLVYVDYKQYHGPRRIPVAGSEYPRLLTNPLEILGDLALRDIFGAFARSDFQEAERLAMRLAASMYEPREAECLARLARGYGAWDRFEFKQGKEALCEAGELLNTFGARGGWGWADAAREALATNLPVLENLSGITDVPARLEDGLPLVLWYLAAAQRLLRVGKTSLAVLLTYAALERYVDLCLWVDFGLHDEKPDYTLVQGVLDVDRYHEVGRGFFGKDYRPSELAGPLMFGNGAQLLATLRADRIAPEALPTLKGLANARNKCEYEHGLLPRVPDGEKAQKFLQKARDIVSSACGGADPLNDQLRRYEFPTLTAP